MTMLTISAPKQQPRESKRAFNTRRKAWAESHPEDPRAEAELRLANTQLEKVARKAQKRSDARVTKRKARKT